MKKEAQAKLNYLKITPRKTRLVADLLKGLPAREAEAQLLALPQRSSHPLLKLLRSAMANAKEKKMETDRLYVDSIRVDKGPVLKRTLPRAMGRATLIQKKSSQITLILKEAEQAFPQKFNIEVIKKEKKKKAESKQKIKPTPPPSQSKEKREKAAAEAVKSKEKPGFLRRIFKRKAA